MMMTTWRRALGVLGVLAAALSGCVSSVDAEPAAGDGTLGRVQQANGPPPCKRWKAPQINPCWGIVASAVCSDPNPDHPSWTEAQKHNYNKWLYSSTSEKACEKFAKKYGQQLNRNLLPVTTEEFTVDQPGGGWTLWARCYGTNNEPSSPTQDPRSPYYGQSCQTVGPTPGVCEQITTYLENASVTPEPCCFRKPKATNRYAGLPAGGATRAGYAFNSSFKGAVKAKNQSDYNTSGDVVSSDLNALGYELDYADQFLWNKGTLVDDDPEGPFLPPPPFSTSENVANVDHMIPRIDTHGCACGDNSPANALVISARLNNELSNRCTADPNNPSDPGHIRQLILDTFTVP